MAFPIAAAIPFIVDAIPSIAKLFGGDKAESAAKDVLNMAKDITGKDTEEDIFKALQSDPQALVEWKKVVLNDKYRLDEMYLQDKQNARELQKEALQQDDLFSKRFLYYFASGWSLFAMCYLAAITFLNIPEANIRVVDTVTGFLLGTLISAIIQFFFGSSHGSSEKNKTQEDMVGLIKGMVNKESNGKQ